jgi:hypothetical protein
LPRGGQRGRRARFDELDATSPDLIADIGRGPFAAFLLVEKQISLPPPFFAVTSEIVVAAPPDRVWPHVIGFAKIAPPNEWIFRARIAYPIRAVIDGHGIGAAGYCIFSTGEFIELITAWNEPAHLAFDVGAQPDPLHEPRPTGSSAPRT